MEGLPHGEGGAQQNVEPFTDQLRLFAAGFGTSEGQVTTAIFEVLQSGAANGADSIEFRMTEVALNCVGRFETYQHGNGALAGRIILEQKQNEIVLRWITAQGEKSVALSDFQSSSLFMNTWFNAKELHREERSRLGRERVEKFPLVPHAVTLKIIASERERSLLLGHFLSAESQRCQSLVAGCSRVSGCLDDLTVEHETARQEIHRLLEEAEFGRNRVATMEAEIAHLNERLVEARLATEKTEKEVAKLRPFQEVLMDARVRLREQAQILQVQQTEFTRLDQQRRDDVAAAEATAREECDRMHATTYEHLQQMIRREWGRMVDSSVVSPYKLINQGETVEVQGRRLVTGAVSAEAAKTIRTWSDRENLRFKVLAVPGGLYNCILEAEMTSEIDVIVTRGLDNLGLPVRLHLPSIDKPPINLRNSSPAIEVFGYPQHATRLQLQEFLGSLGAVEFGFSEDQMTCRASFDSAEKAVQIATILQGIILSAMPLTVRVLRGA